MKKIRNILLSLIFLISLFVIYLNIKLDKELYQPIAKKNSCISCHIDMSGFSKAHMPNKIPCASCHLGNSNSFDKYAAHENMVLVPGNLSNASQTCAKCHEGIDYRVKNSLMNTMSGIISVDKYVFNENSNLDSIFSIHHLKNTSPADKHLRNKCASCHIGSEKSHPNPITEKSRGGGCTACHLNYSDKAKEEHTAYLNSNKEILSKVHPSLSLKITDNHCFGCHSRSGRISTNYEGWHETVFRDTLYNTSNYRVLEDKRVFEKQPADIHHTKGLSCIDCHDSNDVMGDGNTYAHQEDAVNISCEDCHRKDSDNISNVKMISFANLNNEEQLITKLRDLDHINQFVYGEQTKKNLINVIKEDENLVLITKNTSEKHILSKQSKYCFQDVHNSLQCSSCHTSWAPQCISCHTSFDKNSEGYDLFDKEWVEGTWKEKGDHYFAEYPSLGVVIKNNTKTIKTFSPGMVMHLQKKNTTSFHRLFAPVSAHTISDKGKNCKECHNNPVVLGYGRGELSYTNKQWHFKPKFPKEKDGLPQDAWIGFLTNDTIQNSTRKNTRPFNLLEQNRILQVGSCLTCHQEKSAVINFILADYTKALLSKSEMCN